MIYLLRHGECVGNARGVIVGRTDSPLTAIGRGQARSAALALHAAPPERIVSSTLLRAQETAAIIAMALGLPVHLSPALVEIDAGSWTGLRALEFDRFPEWPGGESYEQLLERVLPVLADLAAETATTTLVVTHSGVIRTVLAHAAGTLPLLGPGPHNGELLSLGQLPAAKTLCD